MTVDTPRATVDWEGCLKRLTEGARALRVRTSPAARETLIDYLKQLESWNRTYNLTAVRKPADMVVRHLLDSLAAAPYIAGDSVADIGSGAGLPGIPLALALPRKSFTLVESNGKKAAFLRHVVRTLALDNVDVVQRRSEDYRPARGFDTVVCRAFAAADEAVRLAGHLCAPDGRFVLMKGRDPAAELAALPAGFRVLESAAVTVPGLDAERHIVVLGPGLL
ncbi:glucose-inhibited division protein B [Salinisphaera sp. PC39]|uniref:16S rRNA (guanine(527)-N(7))-methyltransferase RsmG n=1 Tax=Salinisphaera sp. PC39 TaxID=1304156 RepID=UPI00333EBA38